MSSSALSTANFSALSFDQKLDRLAEVSVRIGLGLRDGQELVLTAPTDALPLVRRIVEHAYRAGAKHVTPLSTDDATPPSRYKYWPDSSFDYAPQWLHDAIANAYRSGVARMGITGT